MLSKFFSRNRSTLLAAALVSTLGAGTVQAEVDEIHFLIPGGAGGGWDGTARGVGEALTKSGLVESASYENLSGGGGGNSGGGLAPRNGGSKPQHAHG